MNTCVKNTRAKNKRIENMTIVSLFDRPLLYSMCYITCTSLAFSTLTKLVYAPISMLIS